MTSTLDIIEETYSPETTASDSERHRKSRLAPTNSTSREGSNLEVSSTTGYRQS
jgi:hypothetical protein